MRIIKPYGRSHVAAEPENRRRVLHLSQAAKHGRSDEADIPEFAVSHDELVIAQWISAIDKIATKPKPTKSKQGSRATDEQRQLRKALGDAAWVVLEQKSLLRGLASETERKRLRTLWEMKIAPYGVTPETRKVKARGRWYARFAGDCEPCRIDAEAIAGKIYEHLHQEEYRIKPESPNKRNGGRIAARADSIRTNVLRESPAREEVLRESPVQEEEGWSKADEDAYAAGGDVAAQIVQAAKEIVQAAKDGKGRVNRAIAGAALFDHYARVFRDKSGARLSIKAAKDTQKGLFALHMAVKDCYARLLKNTGKNTEAILKKNAGAILKVLPSDMGGLFRLVGHMGDNRDVNALIRLGKVIHYQAYEAGRDFTNWPEDVSKSRFWGSDGQAEIKRNEAFVRVWRHVLSLAAATLTDWADPGGTIETDILLAKGRKAAMDAFDAATGNKKLALLFGNRAALFADLPADHQKDILAFAIDNTAQLRHSSFHFVGRGGFIATLEKIGANTCSTITKAVAALWDQDSRGRAERIAQTLDGAHAGYFFDEGQNRKLYGQIARSPTGVLPLPRFRRMLIRAEDAWKGRDALGLPASANREGLKNAARMCQYTALKLLYEHPFRAWLEAPDRPVGTYFDKAVARTTKAAQGINGKGKEEAEKALIAAKASRLDRPGPGTRIWDFFFTLSAETATEMRVQRGYASDGEQARKQAEFIEELRCDVVALAFADFLKVHAYSFILDLSPATPLPDRPRCDMGRLAAPRQTAPVQGWQTALYFLLHLVPVDDVGKLLHQLRKWDVLAKPDQDGRKDLDRLMSVLSLYMDMHDAKFEGAEPLTGVESFRRLFDPPGGFDRMFPDQEADNRDERVPRRGLREIMRFGHLPVLEPIFKRHPITTRDVEEWVGAETQPLGGDKSEIARVQERREELHEEWAALKTKEKKSFGKVADYKAALSAVTEHRHRAAHVTLTNHVRLHRLMMTVLGRLVDFSGLWERDLYFVSLALIKRQKRAPADVFGKDGLEELKTGQIVAALRKANEQRQFLQALDARFKDRGRQQGLRNNFMHFEMLRKPDLNLTACVNDARVMMSYDRKLKNAVAQSVIELLEREGLILSWTMTQAHTLNCAKLASRDAKHLGEMKVLVDDTGRTRHITEALHGDAYVRMAAALFDGNMGKSVDDLTEREIERLRLPEKGRTNGKF